MQSEVRSRRRSTITGGRVHAWFRSGPWPRSGLVSATAIALGFASFAFQAPQLVEAAGTGCVAPGSGGPGTLTGIVNSYYPATASAAAGATQISVGPSIPAASAPIAAGDMLLVIQVQDADIQGNNGPTYGDGATGRGSTAIRSTGLYEYVAATSAVVAGVVNIAGTGGGGGLVNNYDFSTSVTATSGLRTFQVIRVPQYSSATVAAGLTAAAWDGAVHAGGVLAIDVAGALNLNGQTISVDQLGFKGGLGVQQNGGGAPLTGADYAVPSASGAHGYKAEGIAGTPHYLYDPIGNAAVNAGADGYPSGVAGVGKDAARGAPGNAGGGGTDANPSANDQNSGGGGGANGGQGGMGGNSWNSNLPTGGLGGAAFPATVARVILGGGGGAGSRNNSTALASSGGAGGGIVMFRVGSVAGTGTITAGGGVGVTPDNDGGGGGGAGGSVVVTSTSGTVTGLTVTAGGGRGTDAFAAGIGAGLRHGPGGGGAGGVIITSPGAATSVLGGAHGITTNLLDAYGSTDGAAGLATTATPGQIPGSSSGAECLPVLTVAKTTSTPIVTNTVTGTSATYTITVANSAGVAPATAVNIADPLPAGFTYASAGGIALNGGATQTAVVNPLVGDTTPTFGTFTIPASGSVAITFSVNIASTVGPGTYSNPATATYLDPARTSAGGTISSSYPGGGPERVTVLVVDMTITKSHVDPFVRGGTGTYTLIANNIGNTNTTAPVTVTDTLPVGLRPTSATGGGWTCPAPAGQTVTCSRPDALAGASSYPPITVTVIVLQSAPSSVVNQAAVAGGGELNTANDTATDPTNIVSSADIAVFKTVDNSTPNQNTNITFTITTINNGPSDATGVQVTDVLPSGLALVMATPSAGTYNVGTGLWDIGALTKGSSATLQIVATVLVTGTVTNTASITHEDQTDPNPANDSAAATVVAGLPGLPNTSGPVGGAPATPPLPLRASGMWLVWMTVSAGLGAFGLVSFGGGDSSSRRSRRRAFGLAAAMTCFALGPLATSQVEPQPSISSSPASLSATAQAGGTDDTLFAGWPAAELIGNKVVTVAPPAPIVAEAFHAVTGAITPARLRIPSIGVDARVDGVGLRSDGSMNVPDNLWTTSWLASGPRPGEAGRSVIAGHRGIGMPALFSHLEDVRPGDRVFVSDASGGQLTYEITGVSVLDLSGASQVAVFGPTAEHELVMITCFGSFLPSTSTYDHRLVVTARELPAGA